MRHEYLLYCNSKHHVQVTFWVKHTKSRSQSMSHEASHERMRCRGLSACSSRPKLASQKPALSRYCLAVSLAGIKELGTELYRHNQAVPSGAHGASAGTSLPSWARHSGSLNQLPACLQRQNRCTVMS